ncbi:MAG: hypothetical protein ACLFPV_08495 [Spirochaetaceae bacterium]
MRGRRDGARGLVLALFFALSACTPRPPEILRVEGEVRLVTDRAAGQEYEQLSLFVQAEDPDGFDDLDEVVLLNDESGLFWRIDRSSWVVVRDGAWMGSAGLTMPFLGSFPRGEYRVVIYDAGGNSEEEFLSIDAPSEAVGEPDIIFGDAEVELVSPESVVLQAVDPQGRTVAQKRIHRGRHPWESVLDGGEVPLDARFFVYVDAPLDGHLPRVVGPFFR